MTWHWNKKRTRDNRAVFSVNTSIDFIGNAKREKNRVVMARIQQTSDNITKAKQKQRNKNKENKTKNKQTNKKNEK